MNMRPIPSPVSKDAITLLHKAQRLFEKAEKLDMVEHEGKKVPSFAADGKGAKDMKTKASMAEKDKYCMKNFGKKYSECSAKQKAQCDKVHGKVEKGNEMCPECGKEKNKMGCMKMGCGGKMDSEDPSDDEMASRDHERDFQKSEAGSQPGFETSFDSNPGGVMFMAESGGQTRSAYYTTNQYLYGGEDVANKGATSESVSMDKLSGQLNPHDGGGVDRQVVDGILSKMRDMLEL
jgi:hypothetical protein